MDSKTMRRLATRPQDMVRYQTTGKLPRTYRPDSPLIRLLEEIPPRKRSLYQGIRLTPDLGYQCDFWFGTAEQLLRWLKPDEEVFEDQAPPSASRQIRGFRKTLTLVDLEKACASYPNPGS